MNATNSPDGNQVRRPSSRRKFSLASEVKMKVASFSHQGKDEWLYVPRKDLLKRFVHDYNNKSLYVGGSDIVLPSFDLKELIHHITVLPPPFVKDFPTGKKLVQIPVFYTTPTVAGPSNQYEVVGQFFPVARSTVDMLAGYHECELAHKHLENHHPDADSFVSTITSSIECTIDVYNCLLRKYTVQSAFDHLLNIFSLSKFKHLNPVGVYVGLMHILVRGVSCSSALKVSSFWRESRTQDELMLLHTKLRSGGNDTLLTLQYVRETTLHCICIRSEMTRLRLGGRHDWSKWNAISIYFYSWYWGVFQQLDPVNQHRATTDLTTTHEEFMSGRETMLSGVGSSLARGLAESPEIDRKIEQIGATIENAVLNATEKAIPILQEAISEESTRINDEARELLQEFTSTIHEVSDSKINRVEGLVEKLSASFESVLSSFDAVKLTLSGMFEKISAGLTSIPGFSGVCVTLDTVLSAIRDYILFNQVESKLLKAVIAISMLNNLGLLKIGYKFLVDICSYLQTVGTETSSFTSILGSGITQVIHVACGVIASVCKGASLTNDEFWSLIKKIADPMKQIHFIGSGCLGMTRIFDFVKKIYETVSEWIMKNIFKQVPEQEALARRVTIWVVKVKYFNSEAGLNAIRLNESVRATASELYSEYLELSALARSQSIYRCFITDIERHKREVQNIYDYIVRLEAMSSFCPTMFHIQFVGQPGAGKSHLVKPFVDDIYKSLWPDDEKKAFYSYNPNLEFFDGYAGQRVFLMDDAFRMQEPKHLTTLIGLITNTPVILPMAHLETKGMQLTSDVMISSTNTPWPIGKDVLCMEAVHRRRHMLVEVVIDEDVRDASTGQFSMPLYLKKYKKEDLASYPHLKFNLLRPIQRSAADSNIQDCSSDQYVELQKYARKLRDANAKIETPGFGQLDPTFYFSDDNQPPEPFTLPCKNWTYNELVHNFVVRYRAFRGLENSYNSKRKYAHVEYAISELEALFNQSADIVEGEYLPTLSETSSRPAHLQRVYGDRVPLISRWFSDVHHPYGVSDPIGCRIAESDDTLSPELTNIDFDGIVNDIIDDNRETSLTIEEELERTRQLRLRNNRLRNQEPAALRERLRVIRGSNKVFVQLNPHSTRWEGFSAKIGPTQWAQKVADVSSMDDFMTLMALGSGPCPARVKWQLMKEIMAFKNSMCKFIYGANAYFPDSEAFFELRGTKSTFPLFFLQNLSYSGGQWLLDVTEWSNHESHYFLESECDVDYNGHTYTIPADVALVLSISATFRAFCVEFDCLSVEQQHLLVEDAKWRNQYTGLYSLEKLRQDTKSILKKTTLTALQYLMSPLSYISNKFPILLHWMGQIAIFCVAVWILRSMAHLILGKSQSDETSKFLHRGPQSNIRYHGRVTAELPAAQLDQFCQKLLARNIRNVQIQTEHGSACIQAIMTGRVIVMPKHIIRKVPAGSNISLKIGIPGTSDFYCYAVNRDQFVESNESDLCMVTDEAFPQVGKVWNHFISEEEFKNLSFEGTIHLLSRFGGDSQVQHHGTLRKSFKPSLRLEDGSEVFVDRTIIVSGSTMVGRSGSTALHITPQQQCKMLGMQIWAIGTQRAPEIAIQVITQELFLKLYEECMERNAGLVTRLWEPEFEPPEQLSGVFTSLETNQVVCKVPERVGLIGKTQFTASPIASLMDMEDKGSKRIPAALNNHDPRLSSDIHPLHHSVNKYVRGTVQALDPYLKNLVVDQISKYISGTLDKEKFQCLSFADTITGTREDGSNPMDLNSSPGIPFIHSRRKKGKRDHFNVSEDGEVDFINEHTLEQYHQFLDHLKRRQLPLTWAYDFPKDELRPEEKVCGTADKPPRTRTVTCMNMFYILAWRQYTLDFWASMHRAADGTFPFCPGINPEGPDWSRAFHYLNKHPNVVDFDVSNWDGYLTSEMLIAAGSIMKKSMDADDETAAVIDSILFEVFNSYIQYDNVIYQKSRGMVSGFPGTAEMNTLVHWMLLVYFYMSIAPIEYRNMEAFKFHVSLLVYGDDIIISISDEIVSWFNGKSIAQEYKNLGYPVTSASKTSEIEEKKTIWECSFLKSSWSHLQNHIYVRKMDESVSLDLLYWVRAKDDPDMQFMSNVIDSVRMMFGHGQEKYDSYLKRLNRWLQHTGFSPITYTYEDLVVDHLYRYYYI